MVPGPGLGCTGRGGAALAVETVLTVGFLVLNPDARTLVRTGLLSVVVKALVLVALAWAVTWVVGSGWLGFGLTVTAGGWFWCWIERSGDTQCKG